MKQYLSALALIVAASACAPITKTPNVDASLIDAEKEIQMEMAEKDNKTYEDRLEAVHYRLTTSNVDLCSNFDMKLTGVRAGRLKPDGPSAARRIMAKVRGYSDELSIIGFTPMGPGERAGLRLGDRILAVEGIRMPTGNANAMDAFERAMAPARKDGSSYTLTIQRSDHVQDIKVVPEKICGIIAYPVRSDVVNAYADGQKVYVTMAMMRLANDDELALILGHEMGHNLLDHIKKQQGNRLLGAFIGAIVSGLTGVNVVEMGANAGQQMMSQDFEAEADYMGVILAARAGYNVGQAAQFWRKMGAMHPSAIHSQGGTHPNTVKRYLAVEAAVREVERKKAAGLPLVPEMKEGGQ